MKYFLFLLILLQSKNAFSCSCMEFNVVEYLKFAKKVYVGKVINVQKLGDEGKMSAALSVSEKFVGQPFDIEEVITGTSNCSAGFTLEETYLVFENESGYVSMCSMIELKYVPNSASNLEALRHLSKFGI